MLRPLRLLLAQLSIFLIFIGATAQTNDKNIETIVHLLDYIARDYSEGVQDGVIVNADEYEEMLEFSAQAHNLTKEGAFLEAKDQHLLEALGELKIFIDEKKSGTEVAELSRQIRNALIDLTGIQTAPAIWPDYDQGRQLYALHCASCHGTTGYGDGELSEGLDPAPSNFHDVELMGQVSPFQAFNTIKLGVTGTTMRAFTELTEAQLWDLAFYIKGLRFEENEIDTKTLRAYFETAYPDLNLKAVATHSDDELLASLSGKTGDATEQLRALRLLAPTGDEAHNSLIVAREQLNAALKSYTENDLSRARNHALTAYLEGIEPVEARLNANDPAFTQKLEQQMLKVRQAIEKDLGVTVLTEETTKAIELIEESGELLESNKLNYWLTFIMSGSIMLREGLEAFLILAIVLALIRTSGTRKALPWLHGGWITAVALGVAGWFLSDYILQFGGKNREIMEGLIALFAVVVLIYVGFWLHNHSHSKKWKDFIENKIGRYLEKDRMFGLAAFSFMVVFREVFEVILFLQAINLESEPENKSAIGLGVLFAILCIAAMVYLFQKYSKRIPVRQLFRYSSWIIVLLAVILIGKGFHSLQESGWVSVTGIPSLFRIDWLGLYPTLETILAQAGLLIFIFIIYKISNQRILQKTVKNA